MHWNERISYYLYTSISFKNEQGYAEKSKRYTSFEEAIDEAKRIIKARPKLRISLERHTEFHDGYHNEWCIDWKTDGGRHVVWSSNAVPKDNE